MKNKINLAMRCNQEQWELLKPKLENAGYNDFHQVGSFEKFGHLTNFIFGENGKIGNIYNNCAGDFNREVHEEFNEKIFLEACGISVIPTLEEVKDYFKDVESVECLVQGAEENISKLHRRGIHYDADSYWAEAIGVTGRYTEIWNEEQGYAKILTYKKDKFEINKETVIKYQMKDEFPEVFRTELITGKWYKAYFKDRNEQWGFINITELKHSRIYFYGISSDSWKTKDWCHDENVFVEVTTEEVIEALKNEALKRYKVGDYIDNSNLKDEDFGEGNKIKGRFRVDNDYTVWCDSTAGYNRQLFRNGIWASVIPTKTVKEAEELLNCKIV